MQKWEDLFDVIHSLAPNVIPDLPKHEPPIAQLGTLAGDDVLIENDHAASFSGGCSDSALPASRIASAIASRAMLPVKSSACTFRFLREHDRATNR